MAIVFLYSGNFTYLKLLYHDYSFMTGCPSFQSIQYGALSGFRVLNSDISGRYPPDSNS